MKSQSNRRFGALHIVVAAALLASGCTARDKDFAESAKAAIAANDLRVAQIELANALKADPKNAELLLLSGQVAIKLGDASRALANFRALEATGKQTALASDYVAKALAMDGKPTAALAKLDAVPPTTDIGFAARVAALLAQGKFDDGFAALQSALLQFPDSVDLGLIDGSRAIALGDMDRAEAIAATLVAKDRGNPEVLIYTGRVALVAGRLSAAEKAFNDVLAVRRDSPLALIALASIAADRGDSKQAKAHLEQVRKLVPKDPVSGAMLAQLVLESGDVAGASDILRSSGAEASPVPAALLVRGLIASRQGYHDQAIASLRDFLGNGGQDGRARFALASSLAAVGDAGAAMDAIRPLANAANASAATLKLAASLAQAAGDAKAGVYQARLTKLAAPDPIAGAMKSADAAIAKRDWASADKIYSRLLAQGHGTNLILVNNAAAVRLELGDTARAVALARQAYAMAPEDPYILDSLGWALFKSEGATGEALSLLREAARLAPDHPEIRLHLATAVNSGR